MKNLSMKVKLLVLVGPMAVAMIAACFFYSSQMNKVSEESNRILYDHLYLISDDLTNADRDYYQAMLAAMQYHDISAGYSDMSPEQINEILASNLETYNENIAQTLERVQKAIQIAAEDPLLYTEVKIEGDSRNFKTHGEDFSAELDAWKATYDLTTGSGSWTDYCEKFESTRESLSAMSDIIATWAEKEREILADSIKHRVIVSFSSFAVIAVILCVLATLISMVIAKSMTEMTERLEVLSHNDLSQDTGTINQNDEIGKMMHAFAEMQRNLADVIGRLKHTADGLVQSCRVMDQNTDEAAMSMNDINNAAGELADTATQTASNVEDVSRRMDDINGIMQRSVATAENLNTASTEINAVTDDGVKIVDTLTKINSQSLEAFETIFRAIANIQDSADKISGASDLISSVAEQTNLLSLNASIEAARAGDAGRGFAVVAEEIRQLSDESASSVDTINTLLAELQQNTNDAIEKSNLVKNLVDKQSESVRDTRGSFDHIVNSVRKVEEAIAEIRNINGELDTGIRNITELVESLSAASEENAATAEELSATSDVVNRNVEELRTTQESINSASDELEEIVHLFKLA